MWHSGSPLKLPEAIFKNYLKGVETILRNALKMRPKTIERKTGPDPVLGYSRGVGGLLPTCDISFQEQGLHQRKTFALP